MDCAEASYRDLFAVAATGTTSFGGITYSTIAQNMTGLIAAGSNGLNHGKVPWFTDPDLHD